MEEFYVDDYVKIEYPEGSYLKGLTRKINDCVYGVHHGEIHKINRIVHTNESVQSDYLNIAKNVNLHEVFSYAYFENVDKLTLLGVPFKYIRHLTKSEKNILIAEKDYNV